MSKARVGCSSSNRVTFSVLSRAHLSSCSLACRGQPLSPPSDPHSPAVVEALRGPGREGERDFSTSLVTHSPCHQTPRSQGPGSPRSSALRVADPNSSGRSNRCPFPLVACIWAMGCVQVSGTASGLCN